MRRAIATVASLILTLGIAAPAAAGPPDGANYTWQYATTSYVSDLSPHAPGVHSRLSISYSAVVDRTGGGTHTRSLVQVITQGYKLSDTGGMDYDWYGGYEWDVTPENPSLGGIDASLSDAWLDAGPITSFCSGTCPSMPAQISVSATWVATGAQTVTASLPTDDIGGVSSLVVRQRPATASIVFSPALDVPPNLLNSYIASQTQIYRYPPPGSGADMILGNGTRNDVAFDFHVVVAPSGQASGRFDSTLMSNIGLPFRGNVDCGWATGHIGVFGGLIDGANPGSAGSYFTVMVSDFPDGIIIGNGRLNCDTTGFGWPGGLPVSSGDIEVIDR